MGAAVATGLVWHERYMWHDTRHAGGPFCRPGAGSSRTSTRRTRTRSDGYATCSTRAGCWTQLTHIEPRDATIDEVCRFHTRAYVDTIQATLR